MAHSSLASLTDSAARAISSDMDIAFQDFISSESIRVIGPSSKSFNIHSTLLVKCSPKLAKAVEKLLAAAGKRDIRLTDKAGDINDDTILHFIEFMYTGDYTVRTIHHITELPATNVPSDQQNAADQQMLLDKPDTSSAANTPAQNVSSQSPANPFANLEQDLKNKTVTDVNMTLLKFDKPAGTPSQGFNFGAPPAISNDNANRVSFKNATQLTDGLENSHGDKFACSNNCYSETLFGPTGNRTNTGSNFGNSLHSSGGLFGSNPSRTNTGGLFGNTPNDGRGLFGSNPSRAGGIFGNPHCGGGGFFGSTPAASGSYELDRGGLFGSSAPSGGFFSFPQATSGIGRLGTCGSFRAPSGSGNISGFFCGGSNQQTPVFNGGAGRGRLFGNTASKPGLFGPSQIESHTLVDKTGHPETQSGHPRNEGTASVLFMPTYEQEGTDMNLYQSINFRFPHHNYSFEELRLADYGAGRRFGHGMRPPHALGPDAFGDIYKVGPDGVGKCRIPFTNPQPSIGNIVQEDPAALFSRQNTRSPWSTFLSQAWAKHTEYWSSRAQKSGWDTSTPDFVCHARLYVFSKRYECEALGHLSLRKLKLALASCDPASCTSAAVSLIVYVYAHTKVSSDGTEPLRALVIDYTACHLDIMVNNTRFRDLVRDGGAFADDLMVQTVQRLK